MLGSPSCLSKWRKNMKKLVQLKLEIINTHEGDQNTYLRCQIAGDACYSSDNGINYKKTQMDETKNKLVTLAPAEGVETIDKNLKSLIDIYQRMEMELVELQERHDADLEVYLIIKGDKWKPYRKSSLKDIDNTINALNKILKGKGEKVQIPN
tara:strand:- start:202 stop:660 length:459 start_codon:yes stop_codon:yes gene_type:complete